MLNHVVSVESAQVLAADLTSTGRTTPVAVVTTPSGLPAPFIDAERLFAEVGDLVPVYLVAPDVARAFSDRMPHHTEVYGGAGRVYPAGTGWVDDTHRSPLRLAFNAAEGERSTELLITDALGMAAAAGLVGNAVATTAEVVSGQVVGVGARRGFVLLESGNYADIVAEITVPGVPADRIVATAMAVTGTLDDAGRLDIRASIRPPEALPYRKGEVVLARVDSVDADSARLALHPELVVEVQREAVTSNPLDGLDSLMSDDEVLRARVECTAPWALILSDLEDDEEARPAFPLIDGGPPWLVEGVPDTGSAEEVGHPAGALWVPSPTCEASTPTPAATEALPTSPTAPPARATVADLEARLATVTADVTRAEAEAATLRTELRLLLTSRTKATNRVEHLEGELARAKQKLRMTRRRPAGDQESTARFPDPEQQFRYDLCVAWAERIPAQDKASRPLCDYTLGPEFLDSVASLQGIKRSKIVDVVVEVLTGIAQEQAGREVHPLRTSDKGGAGRLVRGDGASAWRVSLQIHTPSARRLHYWQLPGGAIELSRVVLHDDYRP